MATALSVETRRRIARECRQLVLSQGRAGAVATLVIAALYLATGVDLTAVEGIDAVHALTSAGDLVRVDLADRSHHVEQTDVRDFQISADRRYLAWRDPGPLNESSLLHLRDNLTGTTTALGDSLNPPAPFALRFADQGLLAVDSSRVHFLPDLSSVAVPNGFFLDSQIGPLADDRWLLFGITFLAKVPGLAILDLKTATAPRSTIAPPASSAATTTASWSSTAPAAASRAPSVARAPCGTSRSPATTRSRGRRRRSSGSSRRGSRSARRSASGSAAAAAHA